MSMNPRLSARGREQGQQQTLFQSTSLPVVPGVGKIIMGLKNSDQIYESASKICAVFQISLLTSTSPPTAFRIKRANFRMI